MVDDDQDSAELREALIRGVLVRTIDATGYLMEAEEAVAAAALIAAQCPEGDPVETPYGPKTPMPLFPSDPRALADEALARIADDEDGPSLRLGRPGGLEAVASHTHAPSRSACPATPFHRSLRHPAVTERHSGS
ncbi:DUF4259 domain-containing protein [Streptomyces sp. NPDC001455]|uniref:DUF4259 domain-containing protein n=1 Tax=unclassified Streptomyces TaxID=2593676 RepID=UPI0033288727